ncbi:MAG: glucose 1-dehydrogenase [Drouetiella hepatica Uher 2000/2452]|jgi:3-oxoacyl-[acyl-carrier protein] reductase|uniref:Glucose 1-dehydrogenase n=1 Tax=Drouetiella hepatica Uher 2000/2452 TaxID=904376 RepID=A0A951QFH0_9CYAN|nr:glucose 1-dehydrogenase [Drouetiella hepatica Uher 2000/2452]
MKLEAKVAVVTGASKGIGAAIAKHLAAEGASVIVNYASSREGADRVVAEITAAGGKAVAVQANVSDQADIIRLFKETVGTYGKLDILVNNAGVYEFLTLAEITPEHFHRQYDLNVLGLILTTQEAVKHIGSDGGSIINMSSVVSTLSPAGSAVYNSTKSAVDGLTRSFAKELAPRHIRVNSINPGLIETEGFQASAIADHGNAVASTTPLGRIGQPQDIAPGVVFLASDDSSWMTGETLYITGGLH